MHRRNFIGLGTGSLAMMPFLQANAFKGDQYFSAEDKPTCLLHLIKNNDEVVRSYAPSKITDRSNPHYGAYLDGNLYTNPLHTGGFLINACCAIACKESSLYRSTSLLTDIEDAGKGLLSLQHSDGTVDLLDTNFHSTPDTAFLVKRLTPPYVLFRDQKIPGSERALSLIEQFLKRAGEALIVGGLHTPNHRWVVCAALTSLFEQWPDQRYLNRINEWLAEHIDLDPDGQYTEKSTGGYSAIIDRVLITIAIGLKKPELLDPVRKNLSMMRYYLHPNGEVVTEASNRQDKGTIGHLDGYYFALRYMAITDTNGEFAAMCRMIEEKHLDKLYSYLGYFRTTPITWKPLPAARPLPSNYAMAFPYSGVVRIRRNAWDCTLLSNNPGFLTFHKKNVVLQGMRLAGSFFGKGQFQSTEIKKEGNSWILQSKIEGVYYQPYPKEQIPPDGNWDKMPKLNRKQSEIQQYETLVRLTEKEMGIEVDIEIKGTDRVPVALEMIFRRGGSFFGAEPHPYKTDAYLFGGDKATYTMGGETISFGPGKALHRNVQLRGALPAMDAPAAFITGFTPFKHTLLLS